MKKQKYSYYYIFSPRRFNVKPDGGKGCKGARLILNLPADVASSCFAEGGNSSAISFKNPENSHNCMIWCDFKFPFPIFITAYSFILNGIVFV